MSSVNLIFMPRTSHCIKRLDLMYVFITKWQTGRHIYAWMMQMPLNMLSSWQLCSDIDLGVKSSSISLSYQTNHALVIVGLGLSSCFGIHCHMIAVMGGFPQSPLSRHHFTHTVAVTDSGSNTVTPEYMSVVSAAKHSNLTLTNDLVGPE